MRAGAKPQDHPDPDLLNAFVEKALGKRDHVEVLEHLSACPRCREIVSISLIQPVVADLVGVVPARRVWTSWPVSRWAAVVACVVVASAVITLHRNHEVRQAARSELAVVATGQSTKVAPPSSGSLSASRAADESTTAASAPVEIADARTGSQFAEMVPGRAKEAVVQSQEPKAEKAMRGALPGKRIVPAEVANSANEETPAENLMPRWTLTSDGTLQRSLDSGRSWQTIPVSQQTIFRALAANGLDIWVGGSAGALYHSSDAGQHWTKVQPVAKGEVLEDDVIGVEFTDTLHGKLTTSNDEIWTTTDSGKTWQKQ